MTYNPNKPPPFHSPGWLRLHANRRVLCDHRSAGAGTSVRQGSGRGNAMKRRRTDDRTMVGGWLLTARRRLFRHQAHRHQVYCVAPWIPASGPPVGRDEMTTGEIRLQVGPAVRQDGMAQNDDCRIPADLADARFLLPHIDIGAEAGLQRLRDLGQARQHVARQMHR